MKKIYTLKKEILFTNNIYEIISMSLDKKISLDEYAIKGEFHLNGEYLVREKEKDTFDITIPYLNYIEDNYDISNIKIDVDDFYYEIKDSNKLVVTIEILVDNLDYLERDEYDIDNDSIIDVMNIEPKMIEEKKEDILNLLDDEEKVVDATIEEGVEKRDEQENIKEEIIEKKEEMSIIEEKEVKYESTIDNEEKTKKEKISSEEENTGFIKYKVCIVRDGDTIDSILEKYGVSLDSIKKYNVINEINVGDKIIIPYERD